MRGYFGIGIDGISKTGNMGNLIRTGHAFGASFAFAVNPKIVAHTGEPITKPFLTDTSNSTDQIPFYQYDTVEDLVVPKGCQLVGVEISDDAIDLPSFRHPTRAVYVLGGERTSLSSAMADRCDMMIKIPTKFSLNVATAGAIVMYDRQRLLGGFPDRPLMAGQKPDAKKAHVHGGPRNRRASKASKTES
ncbi:RNA methyltransferase [Kordiimonas sp. SCSIO 12610]|uniref:RNA methyltransferase n=1 Tax=Kordiimonas sp. SCSIO 12610 TaxID=2829597 RepID=UPI002108671F|nr:RNA methyltransferase [Kordiimonas sp. SCSIO 12610]UTW55619.1 RNA methyltransferase [Kordiimonas sp. SCSIO 12610]